MTALEFALAAGCKEEEAELLLWEGTAFPFAPPEVLWHQLRHVIRHKVCLGDPGARCQPRRIHRIWRRT